MTRINIVPPSELTDQHLMAEYDELPRVGSFLRKSLKKGIRFVRLMIPNMYGYGKGHVSFFYNKGLYLKKRYNDIIKEIHKRKIANVPKEDYPVELFFPEEFINDYKPTEQELEINRKRIQDRINSNPNWYTKTSS